MCQPEALAVDQLPASSCRRSKGMAVCFRAKSIIPALFFLARHDGHARGDGIHAAGIDLCLRNVGAALQVDGHEYGSRYAQSRRRDAMQFACEALPELPAKSLS
jgi:hypothetical protein